MSEIKVKLYGGPAELISQHGECTVKDINDTAKVSYGAGYEHFAHGGEFTTSSDGARVPVFTWCGRTKVAE
ncbi:DUF5988 family protein [Sciscionella marina]|uniref:DUF5988 family protein n=1 Tax=Sciscionella marina TaxID=508770 RepID=UPI0003A64A57|nr:DUF5988 family protein [Sciscionella marina]